MGAHSPRSCAARAVQGRVLAGSVARQGCNDRKFSTKDTNDTKPTHATVVQAATPGPEGRKMIAQRVSAGFRPPMESQPREGRQKASRPGPAPIVRFVIHTSMDLIFDNVHTPRS
jgi:hypothetical protein